MAMLLRLFANATPAHAHCDLYCGVYDPAQAKIEALSCLKTLQKYHDSDDEHFKTRAIIIKEQRAEEVKHHLMVLWADFFTKEHFEQFPNLHQLFWDGVHGAGDVKKSLDVAVAEKLLATIDKIADIFWQTEKAKGMGVYPPGSLVMLSNEAYALVVSVNSSRPLKPQVLVHVPGMPPEETPLIDLEQEADLNISKSLKPGQLPREAMECLNPRKRTPYFFAPKEDD